MNQIPQLSIGTANFNNSYGTYKKTSLSTHEQEVLLGKAWDLGFRSIDTAMSYVGVHQSLSELNNVDKFFLCFFSISY